MSLAPISRFRAVTVAIVLLAVLLATLSLLLGGCGGDEPDAGNATSILGGESVTTGVQPPAPGGTPPTPGPTPPSTPSGGGRPTPPVPGGNGVSTERLAELEEAVDRDSTDLDALQQLGIAYYQAQQYEKAEATYLERLDLEESAEIRNNLGNVYRDWDKKEQAVAQYEKAMELDPTLVYPYSNLAGLYMMAGDLEQAQEIARTGIDQTSGASREQLQALLEALK